MPDEINFMVGGEAGQGVQSVGFWLAKVFARGNFHVFSDQDYESRVRGGHNFFRVRASDKRVYAISENIDMLIALNEETVSLHRDEVVDKGVIIYDNGVVKNISDGEKLFGIPLQNIAEEKAGGKLMENTVALGAALGLLHYDFEIVRKVLLDQFGTGDIGENNVKAARAGYEYTEANYKGEFVRRLSSPPAEAKGILLNGNEAIALGALAAGCKFMAAYPMTPATPIMEYLSKKAEEFGMVVVQSEDEISAINMAVGAGYAGVRSMTATSGSGFCLMVEGLGLAGITETPVVIVNAQRPGPAVGLPTRTEQGDLQFVINAHQGYFPRAVFAPADVEDAFWLTVKAFNIAEKYQIPVIILNDHYHATSYSTIRRPDLKQVSIDRGILYNPESSNPDEYKRHRITENGISPRAFPGMSKALVVTDSDEHDETGHLIEDATTRNAQVKKRMRKFFKLRKEIDGVRLYGPKRADAMLIGWGSTVGALKEAIDILHKENYSVNLLHLSELWPFPADKVINIVHEAKSCYVVENNASGQLSRLIRQETGKQVNGVILKYDGRPFTPAGIVKDWKKEACC